MKNYYTTYVALSSFNVEAVDKLLTVPVNGELELYNITGNEYMFAYEDRYVYLDKSFVEQNTKIAIDLYQEQFSHLDKADLYFGQLEREENFTMEENGQKQYFQKIGEYITQDGIKYNAVQSYSQYNGTYDIYFDADEAQSYEKMEFRYFNEEDIIEKNCKFGWNGVPEFKPIESLHICEHVIKFPEMLKFIESMISGQTLTPELEKLEKEYNKDKYYILEAGMGFVEMEDKPLEEIISLIPEKYRLNKKNKMKF